MAEISYPFVGGATSDAQFSEFFRQFTGSGVRKASAATPDLAVSADSTGMNVKVAAGIAIVRGTFYKNTSQRTLEVEASTGQPRIDSVVLRLEYGSVNDIHLMVKKGTPGPAASVVPPALVQTETGVYEIALADLSVSANAVTIIASNVTDRRLFYSPPEMPPPVVHYGIGRAGKQWDKKSQQIVKTGTVVVRCNVNSAGTFAWPEGAFPNGLTSVTLTSGDNTVATPQFEVAAGTDLSKCVVVARKPGGEGVGANLIRVEYIAYGW